MTGWRKHFKEPYHIVVVGDHDPIVDTGDDITFIECPRIDPVPGQYLPHLDMVHKFRKVMDAYPDTDGFIYACDDMYAVKDFTLDTVKALKMEDDAGVIPDFDYRKETGWWRDLGKTRELRMEEDIIIPDGMCPAQPSDAASETDNEVLTNRHCQNVIDFWNRTVTETNSTLPKVKTLSEERKKKMMSRGWTNKP